MHKIAWLFLPCFFWACQNHEAISDSDKLHLTQESDTLIFDDEVKRYPIHFDYRDNVFILKNKQDSTLEYYDAQTHTLVKSLHPDPAFWEFVVSPTDDIVLFPGRDEVIFMYDTLYNLTGNLTVLDLNSNLVKHQFPININEDTSYVFLKFKRQFQPYFDFEKQKLYTLAVKLVEKEAKKYPLDTEFIVEYDMQTHRSKLLAFKYPAGFENINTCSYQFTTYNCNRGDSMIVSYSISPDIDVYSVTEDKLTRFSVPHPHYDSLAGNSPEAATNYEQCKGGSLTEFFFGPIKYNPSQDLFYRTYRDKMTLMRADSTYNTSANKPLGIQVLNSNLEILGDFPIGEVYPSKEMFEFYPTKNGLLYTNTKSGGDTIIVHYLNFELDAND